MFCEEEMGPHTNRPTDHSPRPEHSLSPSLPPFRPTDLRVAIRETEDGGDGFVEPTDHVVVPCCPSIAKPRKSERVGLRHSTLLYCLSVLFCHPATVRDQTTDDPYLI